MLEERKSGQIFRGYGGRGIERVVVNFLRGSHEVQRGRRREREQRRNSAACARAKQGRRECELTTFPPRSPETVHRLHFVRSLPSSTTVLFHSSFSSSFSSRSTNPGLAVALIKCCALGSARSPGARSSREEPSSLHLHGRLVEAAREDIALMNLSCEWYERGEGEEGEAEEARDDSRITLAVSLDQFLETVKRDPR